jgi:tetratricopeptide (TPR) repeat protein
LSSTGSAAPSPSRLSRLLDYLSSDPENLALIEDAVNAALDESALDDAVALIVRYRALAPLPPVLQNVEGVVALRQQRLGDARALFEGLRAEQHDHSSIRFNLAWIAALEARHEDALALLNDDVVKDVPRAASLKVQTLHHLGQIEEALAAGPGMTELHSGDDALLGALSVAAMDAADVGLARHYADQAQGGADAWTTRGLIQLHDDDPAQAVGLFDQALAAHPQAPRAWLGKGLALLALGDADGAAPCLEKGAAIFEDHLGSWIAAGWTHFIRKDMAAARRSFETALSHDNNFAETHGGLAVLDISDGDINSARRRTEIALRLDKECFGGILARTLLLEMDGKPEVAEKIRDRAMNLPIGVDGKTLAQAMLGLGSIRGREDEGKA